MAKKFGKWVVFYCMLLILSCSVIKGTPCVKSYMNNHRFTYLTNSNLSSKYFVVKDSVQLEYAGDKLYSESIINWHSCTEYDLFIKKVYYTEGGLQAGDTLKVKVNFFRKDTMLCSASAYNQTFTFKVIKNL